MGETERRDEGLVCCVVRSIVRDWEGQRERDQCYKPILEELDRLFPDRCKKSAQSVGEWTIYPWIHSKSNSLADSDQLRPVTIPDIVPAGAGITEGFSMCRGDFVEVYSDPLQEGVWDAVVTCFFSNTAHNIVEYIEIISRLLKDGGVWINLGPLLYHFADMYGQEDEMSIELSLEDVKRVALHYGFQMEKEKTIETKYTTNPRAMMQYLPWTLSCINVEAERTLSLSSLTSTHDLRSDFGKRNILLGLVKLVDNSGRTIELLLFNFSVA
ncbi:Carnosine N-methyltransferase [Dillenia turbinata]|uniref:carnosine N-methyltransferase n=1 Tax=Dillenia turbinata TaxID=194707 RepID=A0AAN8UMQ3_9MAGN